MKKLIYPFLLLVIFSVVFLGYTFQSDPFSESAPSSLDLKTGNNISPDTTPPGNWPYPTTFNWNYSAIPGVNGGTVGAFWHNGRYYLNRWNNNVLYRYNDDGPGGGPGTLADSNTNYAGQIRDITTDGNFLFGGRATNVLYRMDFNGNLVNTKAIPGASFRAIAWDPNRRGFWNTNFGGNIFCHDTNGVLLQTIVSPLAGKYGVAFDSTTSADSAFLWVWDQTSTTTAGLYKYYLGNGQVVATYIFTLPGASLGIAGCANTVQKGNAFMMLLNWQNYAVTGYTLKESGPPPGCIIAGQWAPSGTFPIVPGGTYFGASAWLGDTLYAQNPTATGTAANQIVRYTWNAGWTPGVNLPGPKTGMALVAAAGKLYAVGGSNNSVTAGATNEMLSYDPSNGTWTTLAPMPAVLTGHSAVAWGDSVIFVVGGPWAGSGTNLAVHYYRIASNTWGTIAASLPAGQGRRSFGLGISGNKIIMSAGFNTAFLKSTYVGTIGADASIINWTVAPEVPTTYIGLSRPGATVYDNYFFLVNGERAGSGGYYDTTHVFDVDLNQWVGLINNIPFKRSNIFNNVTARCVKDTISIFIPGGYGNVVPGGAGVGTNLFDVTRVGLLTNVNPISNEIPEVYELSQNYPNPFNPITKINFTLPKNEFVSLRVYDITGREVATLVNEIRGMGIHSVEFDASSLASGAYFYSIQAGDFKQVKKMMLLK